jgi:hypothetical protein
MKIYERKGPDAWLRITKFGFPPENISFSETTADELIEALKGLFVDYSEDSEKYVTRFQINDVTKVVGFSIHGINPQDAMKIIIECVA